MKLSSKKATEKKMTFTIINKSELQQVKGGGKNVNEGSDEDGID